MWGVSVSTEEGVSVYFQLFFLPFFLGGGCKVVLSVLHVSIIYVL